MQSTGVYIDDDYDDSDDYSDVYVPIDEGYNLLSHTKHESRMDIRLRRSLCAVETRERDVSVFTGTWNLHAKSPPDRLHAFIPPHEYDVYVIGTEECEATIQKSFVMRSKERWTSKVTEHLGSEYIEVAQETLMAIHIIAFVRKDMYHLIDSIETGRVATGIANRLGNKGGVGVCFNIGSTSFVFINCHFAAHHSNVAERNANFHDINHKMPFRGNSDNDSSNNTNECSERFDYVFWMGDLNYRVQGTRRMIDTLIAHDMLEVMRVNDQLTLERRKGSVFNGFDEGPLEFMPTYKFDPGTDVYDSSTKQRIPSWTDRILYRCRPSQWIEMIDYQSAPHIRTSDHRPVFATFRVRTRPPTQHTFIITRALQSPVRSHIDGDEPRSVVCTVQ